MDGYLKWLENSGISFPNVDVRFIDKFSGYGLFARKDIRLNEFLIKVPERFMVTAPFVANIAEYARIQKRFRLEPSELLALFFAFERVYFDYFCEQNADDFCDSSSSLSDSKKDEAAVFFVHWTMSKPNGLRRFLAKREKHKKATTKKKGEEEKGGAADYLWWRSYVSILPRRFCTPLFKYYLSEGGTEKLKQIASRLPLEAREKLLAQIVELAQFEQKLFNVLIECAEMEGKNEKEEVESDLEEKEEEEKEMFNKQKEGKKLKDEEKKKEEEKEDEDDGLSQQLAKTHFLPRENEEEEEVVVDGKNMKKNEVEGKGEKREAENNNSRGGEMCDGSKCFWKEICCWAWHIVNTRSIFVDNLPFHPLVDHRDKTPPSKNINISLQNKRQKRRKSKGKEEEEEESFGGNLALVPLLDMLNHSPNAQCLPMFDKKSRVYTVRAEHHSIVAGQQLFFCYGAHNNETLWLEYGFRLQGEEENPFNRVSIPNALFIALAERCGRKVSSTRREILEKARLPCTIYATDEMPSFGLRKNCSILLLEKEKLSDWSRHIFSITEEEEEEEEKKEEEEHFYEHNKLEGEEKNEEGKKVRKSPETKLLVAILQKLENALIARKEGEMGEKGEISSPIFSEITEEIRPFWMDQIRILQRMLRNLC